MDNSHYPILTGYSLPLSHRSLAQLSTVEGQGHPPLLTSWVTRVLATLRERRETRLALARLTPGVYQELRARGLDIEAEVRKPLWRA